MLVQVDGQSASAYVHTYAGPNLQGRICPSTLGGGGGGGFVVVSSAHRLIGRKHPKALVDWMQRRDGRAAYDLGREVSRDFSPAQSGRRKSYNYVTIGQTQCKQMRGVFPDHPKIRHLARNHRPPLAGLLLYHVARVDLGGSAETLEATPRPPRLKTMGQGAGVGIYLGNRQQSRMSLTYSIYGRFNIALFQWPLLRYVSKAVPS
ncbi:hypothetical protein LZ30DRAFT_22626 [Colletotrichum cereale]|nr:hypothetical protein LZ30DRAFT_22626 [Colletotrichum cereale]